MESILHMECMYTTLDLSENRNLPSQTRIIKNLKKKEKKKIASSSYVSYPQPIYPAGQWDADSTILPTYTLHEGLHLSNQRSWGYLVEKWREATPHALHGYHYKY